MEIALMVVGPLVLLWIRQYRYARRVTTLRARELSSATGIPSDRIEREILQRRITPGEWAREHGLDPLTFRRPEASPSGAFAERKLPEPDWAQVTGLFAGDERQNSCCSGWTVSLADPINHPTSLYLTDAALYVSIRPDTMFPDAETHRWPKDRVVAYDTAQQPDGGIRLMAAFESDPSQDAPPVMLAVDLRPIPRGRSFAEDLTRWIGKNPSTSAEWPAPPAQSAPPRPARRKDRLPSQPDGAQS